MRPWAPSRGSGISEGRRVRGPLTNRIPEDRRLQGALLGVGHVALRGHLPGWQSRPDATLTAAADPRSEGKDAFLAAFPAARWYTSAEELLAKENLDFVDVCTPPALHAPMVQAALERSCSVLCEKPLVLRRENLVALTRLAEGKGRALVTVHNWKHAPALQKTAELVQQGAIGRIRRWRWETLRQEPAASVGETGNWRLDPAQSGGGILVDHGWHAFYVLQEFLGRAPNSVAARLETRKHGGLPVEDTATVHLDYGEASAEIFLTWAAAERGNRVEIEGTEGALRLEGGRLELLGGRAGPEGSRWDLPSLSDGSHHPEWFAGVLGGFLAEVSDPALRGRNLAEASLCVELLSLARESSRRGGSALPLEAFDDPGPGQ
jgi:predicted dehydrogenase